MSISTLNATGKALRQINRVLRCHIICDWVQFPPKFALSAKSVELAKGRSRFCQITNLAARTDVGAAEIGPEYGRFFSVANNLARPVAFNVENDSCERTHSLAYESNSQMVAQL
jgi:hypothetical protein